MIKQEERDNEFVAWKENVTSGHICGPCTKKQKVEWDHASHCYNADIESELIVCAGQEAWQKSREITIKEVLAMAKKAIKLFKEVGE